MKDEWPRDIDTFTLMVLDAINHYRSAHYRYPGEVQVSPHDWGRMAKQYGGADPPPSYGLLWGFPARAVDTVAVGRVRLVVRESRTS